MTEKLLISCQSAGERFFRLYHKHCVAPDADTLFNLLNSIHSLNDKVDKATGENFYSCKEFVTIKALLNLFHHEAELINEVRIIPVADLPPLTSDLLYLCLIPKSLAVQCVERLDNRHYHDKEIIRTTLKWYGEVVNINPCLFNFAVHALEKLKALDVVLKGEEYVEFEENYWFEEEAGHSHFINAAVLCHAGSVEKILTRAFAEVT